MLKIQRRLGHAALETTQDYIREAENLIIPAASVFPNLPLGLLADEVDADKARRRGQRSLEKTLVKPQSGKWVSNPRFCKENTEEPALPGGSLVDVPPIAYNEASDSVEAALAMALEGATRAGEWAMVARLAGELEARRLARANVVDLASVRREKGAR